MRGRARELQVSFLLTGNMASRVNDAAALYGFAAGPLSRPIRVTIADAGFSYLSRLLRL